MLYLDRIKALFDFLRWGQPSTDAILKFVTLDTLYEFSAFTVFLNVVRLDGTVHIPSGYGFDSEAFKLIPARLVSVDTPINRSLRTGAITECGDIDSFLFSGPDYSQKLFPNGFKYSMAWPIPGVGSVVTFCAKDFEMTAEAKKFLLIVGEIISMELLRVRANLDTNLSRSNGQPSRPTSLTLSPRQWTILAAIRKGRTNLEIAIELGFSESLIRQETVQLYRKLGVTGRKEILDSDISNGDRFATFQPSAH